MRTILGNELFKTFSRWRSYIAFIAIGIVVPLALIGVKVSGDSLVKGVSRGLTAGLLLPDDILNGYFVTYFIMNALWIHIPFLLTLSAGDQLAGEATAGTFRILLTRPASRTRILVMKYLTTLLYTFAIVLFTVGLSLALGLSLFGSGAIVVPGARLTIIPAGEGFARMLLATFLATWGMWTVASLAFLFSSLVDNALGPIIGTMAVIIVFYVVSNIPIDLFRALKPYLFTSYLNIWQKAFTEPLAWREIAHYGSILGAFTVGFYLVTWYIFVRKDILS